MLVMAESEDFDRLFGRLNDDFHEFPQVLAYVKTIWIDKYKEYFVAYCTDTVMHLGNTTLNRAESAHAKLKRYLSSSLENFDTSWAKKHALWVAAYRDKCLLKRVLMLYYKTLSHLNSSFYMALCTLMH